MAFYTPTWVRRLVKEDHKSIQDLLNKQGTDFREYIDSNTPFVLWLDISIIRERILERSKPYIKELALTVSQTRDVSDIVIKLLDKAYIATINDYATNSRYLKIDQKQLEDILTQLSNAGVGSVKKTIGTNFNRTMIVTTVTKKNKSVMLILPKFTTLNFGSVFKKQLAAVIEASNELEDAAPVAAVGGMFAGLIKPGSKGPSEKSRMLDFVSENFAKLQNIGHVEVDVVSEADRKVMRGQNSPRLIQALVALPNDLKSFEKLQVQFSKETGQVETRVKVRKKFKGSKLVFELLIEHGLAVGIPETQEDNLYKAKLERAFVLGRGLSATIRKDISILSELETSKSINKYIEEALINTLLGKTVVDYTSNTTITQATRVKKTKVSTKQLSKNPKSSATPTLRGQRIDAKATENLVSLQNLINQNLARQIQSNMGTGDSTRVLNYRTGRLAESAKVERMTESRQGMITAFYSYMRNPYGTFAEGGAQEFPTSRNPKTLIARSIRELAGVQVANRMRAVLV